MASFSFGAGNARKLARIPLYAAGRAATALIPRSRDEWVFGSAAGLADGALALWRAADGGGHRMRWLAGSAQELRDAHALGIPAVPRDGAAGFWRTARARVVVVTHGFGDANRYAVGGAFIVQLWHGIPLKRIGIDAPETVRVPAVLAPLAWLLRPVLAWLYRRTTRQIGLIPAASHLVRGRLESAFSLPCGRAQVTGEPRTDVLCAGEPDARRASARALLERLVGPIPAARRVILYAPTWRDGADDPAIPDAATWERILQVLRRRDATLLIRSHPLGAGRYAPPDDERIRMLGNGLLADVTPALPGVDLLVTDYSSIVFDAALVPVPAVFLAPDVADYARTRGFYGTFADVAGGDAATDWTGALAQMDTVLADRREAKRRREAAAALSARVHAWTDGHSARRVYEHACAAVDAPVGRRRRPELCRGREPA